MHPNVSEAEALRVRSLGEYRYNQEKLRTALAWIAAQPTRTAALIGQRAWYFWFPADFGWKSYAAQRKRFAALHLLTVLSFAGLWLAWRRRMACARVLTLWLGLFPLIYYVVQFEVRYRTPILWISYLLAAFAIQSAFERTKRGGGPHGVL
jgi:hypothetical protein